MRKKIDLLPARSLSSTMVTLRRYRQAWSRLLQSAYSIENGMFTTAGIDNTAAYLLNVELWETTINALTDSDRRYLLDSLHSRIVHGDSWIGKTNELLARQLDEISTCMRKLVLGAPDRDAIEILSSWNDLIECFTKHYDQSLLVNELGVMAGAIRAGRQTGRVGQLFSSDVPLVRRTRYAKSQLNRAAWWREQCSLINTDYDRHLWLLCLYAWASPGVILELLNEIETQIADLSESSRTAVIEAARRASNYSPRSRIVFDKGQSASLIGRSPAVICFLYDRIDQDAVADLILKNVEPTAATAYEGNIILNFVGKSMVAGKISGKIVLNLMARGYNLGADEDCGFRFRSGVWPSRLALNWRKLYSRTAGICLPMY